MWDVRRAKVVARDRAKVREGAKWIPILRGSPRIQAKAPSPIVLLRASSSLIQF